MAPFFRQDVKTAEALASVAWAYSKDCIVMAIVVASLASPIGGTSAWDMLRAWWPYSERALFVAGSLLIHNGLYFSMGFFYLACDRQGWCRRYRLPRRPAQEADPELIQRTVLEGSVSHLLVEPFTLWFVYDVFTYFGMSAEAADVPRPTVVFGQFLLQTAALDFLFYVTHRALHHPRLYKFHKKHHEYKGTVAFAAEHASLLEQVVSNQVPTALLGALMGVHMLVWWVWLAHRLWETYQTHSGYAFPFLNYDSTRCAWVRCDILVYPPISHAASLPWEDHDHHHVSPQTSALPRAIDLTRVSGAFHTDCQHGHVRRRTTLRLAVWHEREVAGGGG